MTLSRRRFIAGAGALVVTARARAQPDDGVTFVFVSDIHACRMETGLSPHCQQEGKTDENLLRHIHALNALPDLAWPETLNGVPSGLSVAGLRVGVPRGVVVGGDMTDDGGGQIVLPSEGTQLLQFSQRYQQGIGEGRIHFPVYAGLGNHDLDQDGPSGHVDWYRRELRDYVEVNHREGVFFKPPVPADSYDVDSDSYSWNWGGLHLVQLHRFGGDTTKGAISALPWLRRDLAQNASGGAPVVIFQHYGWDSFSVERWDAQNTTFDSHGLGAPHWWSEQDRQALIDTLAGYNVVGIFHGHEHDTPMIYKAGGYDLFKPKAAFKGGFALARAGVDRMDVVLGESDAAGGVMFTDALSKTF